jgi:hypothetical protein
MGVASALLAFLRSALLQGPFVTAPFHVSADAEPVAILSLSPDARFDGREVLTKYIRTSAEQVSENGSVSATAWHSLARAFLCFSLLFFALPPCRLSQSC